jgi:putative transposase
MSRTTSRGEATVVEVCEAFALSRQGYYAAKRREEEAAAREAAMPPWQTSGRREIAAPGATLEVDLEADVLEPGDRGRAGHGAARVLAAIVAVIRRSPAWGVRKVWAFLRHIRGWVVSRRRVWALMKAHALVLPASGPERRDTPPRGHVAVPESNRRWATDLTTQWTLRDGVVAIVPVIDCGDRVALAIEITKSQEAPPVLRPVERAAEEIFGDRRHVPDGLELRTDHGPQYTGADAEALCVRWALAHTFAPVGRPTGNAIAERFIQTLKVELLWTRDWESIEELREAIAAWVLRYNGERPHQSLGWQTPDERRAINLGEPLERAA